MLRPYVVRTLLYKEVLRFRYNWGLLVVIVAVLAMSVLVSISAQMPRTVLSPAAVAVDRCLVVHEEGSAWAEHLKQHRPPLKAGQRVDFAPRAERARRTGTGRGAVAVWLAEPPTTGTSYRIVYHYPQDTAGGVMPYRDWLLTETRAFLDTRPRIEEEHVHVELPQDRAEVVPVVITALVIFATYLLSFNLYITSTGEERERRVLLALLLSPASPLEIIAAKILFYGSASMLVALAVVGMYKPALLARPVLWSSVAFASLGYIALGTIVLCVVRRQTTLSTVSMLYLVATAIIFSLGQFLPLFTLLANLQFEFYLNRQLQGILSEGAVRAHWLGQVALGFLALVWTAVAVTVFQRRGIASAGSR